jgi:streptogramin lyase
MKSAWILSATTILPKFLKARGVSALFAPTCRFAAVVLNRVALLALMAFAFGLTAPAQTAHLSNAQNILIPSGSLDYPQGVAVDGSGNIFVADAYNKRVLKLTPSPSGGFTQSTVGTGLGIPYGVAVDTSGNIYIADITLTTLLKETPSANGYTQSTIGNGLYDATSVAVDNQGNVYGVEVNNSFVGTLFKETLSGGTYTQSFIPVPGSHGVFSVAVDGNGNLFLDDGWDGIVFEQSPVNGGGYKTTELYDGAAAIAVDGNNDVYIASYPGNIEKLTPSGSSYTTSYISTNATNTPYGYFDAGGLAVDMNGNIYFTDLYTYSLIEEAITSGNFGLVSVNISSNPVSMFFTFDTAGTLGSTSVSTQGAASLDFSDAGTGDCYATQSFGVGDSCWIDVTFTPVAAGVRSGAAELLDGNGNPFATGYVQGTGVAPLVNFGPGTPIIENILSDGFAVAVDTTGTLYTVTPGSSTAFKDTPGGGPSGWNETPIGSGLGSATGIAIDGGGNLYIADQTNREIVKETLTSTGYSQSVIANQSNGLNEAAGVAVDESGNVYVSDLGTNSVLKETPSAGGYVQSVVPTGALNQPNSVAVDSIGSVYIADTNNNRVLKETPAAGGYTESTIGSGLSSPTAVAVDAFGNVYISKTGTGDVFKETLAAGSYLQSTVESGIHPYGLAVDSNLNLYIAGSNSQLMVKLDVADAPTLNFASTGIGQVSSDSPRAITLSNAGNAPLTIPVIAGQNNPYISAGYLLDTSTAQDCPVVSSGSIAPGTLANGASCLLSISFSPLSAGPDLGDLTIFDNNQNASAPNYSSQTITLLGAGAVLQAQTINFPVIAAQTAGTMLNLSATATSGLVVSFSSTTPATCTVAGSMASLIASGTCTIQASQGGNNQYSAAANVSQSFMVNAQSQQTINFPVIAAQTAGTMLNLSATATSGLAVGFASTTPATCTVAGGTASLIAGGTCTIQASQAGNNQYSAAANVSQSFNVNFETQTINFPGIAAQTAGTMLSLSATATSGLAVSFSSTTPATCTVTGSTASLIASGSCTIQASQAGNNQYSAAANVGQSFNVKTATQTITFAAIAAQNIGATLNLSATASSGLAVNFSSTTPAICTVAGDSASMIGPGTCTIQASQPGNNAYSAAPNVSQGFMVNTQSQQTITFAVIPAQNVGVTLNLSATASSGLAVNFSSTTPAICTVSGGTASLIAGGNCIIEASQPGNVQYAAAPNVFRLFAVNLFPQTITFAAMPAQVVGATLNLSATASSGLPLSFLSGLTAVCTVSGNTVSMIAPGNCIIEASQPGNAHFAAAPNVIRLFAVSLAPQSITFAAIAPQNIGTTLNLSATATSGLAVNFSSTTPAICMVTGNSASMIAPGACTIEASQAGNHQYAAAPNVGRTFGVKLFPQTITFAALPAQNIGATLTLSATASSGLAVTFSSTTPAICMVTGNSASMIAPGNCTIEASQPGNGHYAAAPNVSRTFAVNLLPQTITFAVIPAQNIGATLNLSATASSGLTISFSSLTPAVCTISGNAASLIAPGNCIIRASQAGNGQYAAAANVSRIFAVNLFPQTITFGAIAAQNIGTTLNLSATATSGLAVSFLSATPAVCTVTLNKASLVGLGICNIEASQPGNGKYAAAPNVNRNFKVVP